MGIGPIAGIPRPRKIRPVGDEAPGSSLYGYVFHMSGWHQGAVAGLAVLVAGLEMAPLELQRLIIDEVIANREIDLLLAMGGVYLLVIIVQQALKFVLKVYQSWIGENATRSAREHLSELYRDNPKQVGAGSAVTVISSEIDQVGAFIGNAVSDVLIYGGMLIALFGYMVAVEPVIAGISVLFFLPQALLVPLIQARINHYVDHRVGLLRRLGDRVGHTRFGDLDDPAWRRFRRRLDLIYFNHMRTYVLKFTSKVLVNGLNALAPLSVLVVGGWLVIVGETTIGVVVAFINGFERMADPLRELIDFYRLAALTRVKYARIAQWMKARHVPDAAPAEGGAARA